jgi:vacuolar-type H+-ATPase subunit H
MDEHDVLGHLLQIEAEAAALMDDAQAEADKRIAEAEKHNRLNYDETFSREAGALDEEYRRETAAVREDYQKQLNAYHEHLSAMQVNEIAFFRLLEDLLLKE